MRWLLFIVTVVLSGHTLAQDQMAVRLNEKGLLKILELGIKYNTQSNSRSFVVPQNLYKFTLKKSQFTSNPMVPVLNQISNLDLGRDFNFYLHTSNIVITGAVDPSSLRTVITNSHAQGFDFRLTLALPSVQVKAPSLSLCETQAKGLKRCGNGLKMSLGSLAIGTKGRPVTISANMRLSTSHGVARVKVLSVSSNLESSSAPTLDINFASLTVPPISIIVNGEETELDTSKLRGEILAKKHFLAKKLMSFVADFITGDVAEMINGYLVKKEVVTSWEISRKKGGNFDKFLPQAPKATYQVPAMNGPVKDPMKLLMDQIAKIITTASMGVSLSKISTPGNKDMEFYGQMNLMLNGKSMQLKNTLGNSARVMPKLDLNSQRNNHVNLALSEPLINGALDLVSSTGLFQKVFDQTADVPGFAIKNVKVHFTPQNTIMVVVNSSVDLKLLESASIGDWFKNWYAVWSEMDNNKAVIYFPIEIEVIPNFRKTATGMAMDIKVLSPFENGLLQNEFRYPSNVSKMEDVVRKGVMSKLGESLNQFVNKTYPVDLSKFLNQSGVAFQPKVISVNQSAFILLSLDLIDIKFTGAKPLGIQ